MTDIIQPIADPKRPLDLQRTARRMWTARTVLAVAGIVVSLTGLALAWQYYAAERLHRHRLRCVGHLSGMRNPSWRRCLRWRRSCWAGWSYSRSSS